MGMSVCDARCFIGTVNFMQMQMKDLCIIYVVKGTEKHNKMKLRIQNRNDAKIREIFSITRAQNNKMLAQVFNFN